MYENRASKDLCVALSTASVRNKLVLKLFLKSVQELELAMTANTPRILLENHQQNNYYNQVILKNKTVLNRLS